MVRYDTFTLLQTLTPTSEIPNDPKSPSYDPFRHYPDFELQALPPDMPTEYRKQMRTLLPYTDPNKTVAHLAYATVDASGVISSLSPMQNRPWEWTENLGEIISPEDKDNNERSKIKNTASVSLELFGAQATGESVLQQTQTDNPHLTNTILSFEDHLHGEGVFQRDWRESRVSPDDPVLTSPTERAELEDQVGPLPSFSAQPQGSSSKHTSTRGSRRPSPASSVRSRSSLHAQNIPSVGSSLRQSPMQPAHSQSGSTAGDPIDVDAFDIHSSSSRTGKRKADKDALEPASSKRAKSKSSSTSRSKAR